jgi:hypothetical protein
MPENDPVSDLLEALGGLYAHVGQVLAGEVPHTDACSWYANGKATPIDKFAGYSLSRANALAAHSAMKRILDGAGK